MKQPRTSRAGFTLLEVMLAAAIGSAVAIASAGLLLALTRNDRQLSERYREIAQLERTHTIMSRAFSSILVAERSNVRSNRPRATPQTTDGTAAATDSNSTARNASTTASKPRNDVSGRSNRVTATPENQAEPGTTPATGGTKGQNAAPKSDPKKPEQPARVSLRTDGALAGLGMSRPANARLTMGEPQRFEIVLATPPVPQRASARMRAQAAAAAEASVLERAAGNSPMPESTGQAIRGVFELRPTVTGDGRPMFTPEGAVRSWTLWWRPLPGLMQLQDGTVVEAGPPSGEPVEVATDLSYCRWQVFDDRQRKTDYSAVYFTDLPAYIEMEVATTSGLWANWMFEVDWATGSESAGAAPADAEDESAAETLSGRVRQAQPAVTGGSEK